MLTVRLEKSAQSVSTSFRILCWPHLRPPVRSLCLLALSKDWPALQSWLAQELVQLLPLAALVVWPLAPQWPEVMLPEPPTSCPRMLARLMNRRKPLAVRHP